MKKTTASRFLTDEENRIIDLECMLHHVIGLLDTDTAKVIDANKAFLLMKDPNTHWHVEGLKEFHDSMVEQRMLDAHY